MNKHIVGFILFNLIVGTSLVIAALSYNVPKYESVIIPVTSETYTHSCWKSRKYANNLTSAKVTQAIFDSKTQELKTELFIQSKNKFSGDLIIDLHFFVKNGNSTRYLSTQEISESVSNDAKDNTFVTYSYDITDDLKQRENLYVVPEIISNTNNYNNYTPVF